VAEKKIIATGSLAGCFGCHMSLLDIDERILQLIELVEFNKSPINDIKTFTKHCDIGLIEGGCCNDENVHNLIAFRENCTTLVAVGECAIMGGLPSLRNTIPLEECLREAYPSDPPWWTPTRAASSRPILTSRRSSIGSIPVTRW
jgi:NAD-reducing hydrogenase small subunit